MFLLHYNILRGKEFGYPWQLCNALQSLKRNDQIIILKADKGNMVVIMDKANYLSAAHEMLSDTNVYDRLRKNPIVTEQSNYNKEVKRIFESMPIGAVPSRFNAYLPTLAHLYIPFSAT